MTKQNINLEGIVKKINVSSYKGDSHFNNYIIFDIETPNGIEKASFPLLEMIFPSLTGASKIKIVENNLNTLIPYLPEIMNQKIKYNLESEQEMINSDYSSDKRKYSLEILSGNLKELKFKSNIYEVI